MITAHMGTVEWMKILEDLAIVGASSKRYGHMSDSVIVDSVNAKWEDSDMDMAEWKMYRSSAQTPKKCA